MRLIIFLGGVELFDKSRGGDETRHKYRTHSEWHTDSKFVGLLKVGYQTSILCRNQRILVEEAKYGCIE